MASSTRPPTLSQALLSLGRINAVENSIAQGVSALHRAKKVVCDSKEMPVDVQKEVKRFGEFCVNFHTIVSAEDKDFKSIEKWLLDKEENEVTSRLDTFLVIYPLFPNDKSKSQRKKWAAELENIGKIAKDLEKGQCEKNRINRAIRALHRLSSEARELDVEKEISEKVLSGRTLIT